MLAHSRTELAPLKIVRLLRRQEQALSNVMAFYQEQVHKGRVRELRTIAWPPLRWFNRVLRGLRRLLRAPGLFSRERPMNEAERSALSQQVQAVQAELSALRRQLDESIARARTRVATHAPLAEPGPGSLYPDDWPAISLEYRRRVGFICEECGHFAPDGHVHHIVPVSRGGSSDPRNLIFLCRADHAAKHPHMAGVQ